MAQTRHEVRFADRSSHRGSSPDSGAESDHTRSDEPRQSTTNEPEACVPSQTFGQPFLSGLHLWTSWRTEMNGTLVDIIDERRRIFSYPGSVRMLRKHKKEYEKLTEPNIVIDQMVSDFALERAVFDQFNRFNLQPPSFVSFGIPRVSINKHRPRVNSPKKLRALRERCPYFSHNFPEDSELDFHESELQRSKMNARYQKKFQDRTKDQMVVIVKSVNNKADSDEQEDPDGTESICAVMNIPDEQEEID